jgi:very-short-patch-repair endonuclease
MTRLPARSAAATIAAQGSDGERAFETQLRQTGATGWVRELQFDVARRWRFDFAWPDLSVAVEIEGGTWSAGRHSRGAGFEADCMKYSEAAIRGWMVLRVTTDMVDDGRAVTLLGRALWSASQRRNR